MEQNVYFYHVTEINTYCSTNEQKGITTFDKADIEISCSEAVVGLMRVS